MADVERLRDAEQRSGALFDHRPAAPSERSRSRVFARTAQQPITRRRRRMDRDRASFRSRCVPAT
jgi:hypothetical protein